MPLFSLKKISQSPTYDEGDYLIYDSEKDEFYKYSQDSADVEKVSGSEVELKGVFNRAEPNALPLAVKKRYAQPKVAKWDEDQGDFSLKKPNSSERVYAKQYIANLDGDSSLETDVEVALKVRKLAKVEDEVIG